MRMVMPESRRPSTQISGRRLVVVPSGLVVRGISPMGSVNVVNPHAAWMASFTSYCVLVRLPPALLEETQSRWSKARCGARAACGRMQQCAMR